MIGGRYRLREPLGAGAMGEVWRAEHVSLGTPLAVKLVDTAKHDNAAELLARFQIEARAAAQLRSPHVVQVLDHGVEGRVAFIAMEVLEGESLEQRLERRQRLMPSEAAHILREAARGLERAHAAGIVHRDLKPSNIFLARVDDIEVVKILDFGIAKVVGGRGDAHLQTQQGYIMGTPAYMSPEQVLGLAVSPRSDLWQLAVIAFECVTGRRPFDGDTLGQLFMHICHSPIPAPSSFALPPGAPVPPVLREFDAWFARAADRDPERRFASAGAMVESLCGIFAPGGGGESAIPTVTSANRPPPAFPMNTGRNDAWSTGQAPAARPRVPASVVAGMALAPLLSLVVGALWWWHGHRAPPDASQASPAAGSSSEAPPVGSGASPAGAPAPDGSARAAGDPKAAAVTPPAPPASGGAPVTTSASPPVPAPRPGTRRPAAPSPRPDGDRIGL